MAKEDTEEIGVAIDVQAEPVDVEQLRIQAKEDFAKGVVIPGYEQLGRIIVDAQGVPSGSPANIEALRIEAIDTHEQLQAVPTAASVDAVLQQVLDESGLSLDDFKG